MQSFSRIVLLAAVAATLPLAATSQAPDGACILAGRLAEDGHWAPRFEGVQLLGADGRGIVGGKSAIGGARQVRLAQPALLSRCDGSGPLANLDDQPPLTKGQVPALAAGTAEVESVAFPKLRTGGELVELKVRYPAERVVMLTR
jgi:hypothetical protein